MSENKESHIIHLKITIYKICIFRHYPEKQYLIDFGR